MSTTQWPRLRLLLEDALELPASKRREFLDSVCPDDAHLRRQLEELLERDQTSVTFLEPPLDGAAENMAVQLDEHEAVGARLGAYRLTGVIAGGGMGTIYRARRDDDEYDKEVAVKVLRSCLRSSRARERFHRERQILASLEHPNITRLIDGGATHDGRPFIVMEYVQGVPITQYARENTLSVRERLALFERVCRAVQFAHRNLIVHRDLKPGNLLVTDDGRVKLLDFGISKLLNVDGTDAADVMTLTIEAPMTLCYSSPEQVGGETITTASDIYSLGVVLYELLTGEPPFKTGASMPETIMAIRRETPLPPSSRAEGLNRELDAIVLCALEKSPSRRYDTVEALAADVTRYLRGEAVLAHPPARWYALRKAAWRHRWQVSLAATVFILLAAFSLVATTLMIHLEHERTVAVEAKNREAAALVTAEDINEFLAETLVSADPLLDGKRDLSVLKLLDDASARLNGDLAGDNRARAALHLTLGRAYLNLWRIKDAEPHLLRALGLYRRDHEQVNSLAETLEQLAQVRKWQFDPSRGEALLKECLAIRAAQPDTAPAEMDRLRVALAESLSWQGRPADAEEVLRQVVSPPGTTNPADDVYFNALNKLAQLRAEQGDAAEAELLFHQSMEKRRAAHGERHPSIAEGLESGGWIYDELDAPEKAADLFRQALRLRVQLSDERHPSTIHTRLHCGYFAFKAGESEEGEALMAGAVEVARDTLPDWHYTRRYARSFYGLHLYGQGRYEEAEPHLLAAHQVTLRSLGPGNELSESVRQNLVNLYDAWGRAGEADRYRTPGESGTGRAGD